jgi:hypothetical protein
MSKINAGLYSSEDHTWMTPPALVDALLRFEGRKGFDLDPCCSVKNIPAYVHYTHPDFDGLALPWLTGVDETLVFVNPPYGKKLARFMAAIHGNMMAFSSFGLKVWALIPARTETQYQHQWGLKSANFTVFLKGRLHFLQNGEDKGSAPFPTMLLYYGDDWQEKAERWIQNPPLDGTLMVPKNAC